ncbi:alpha/beta hydrolase [Roseibium suaedae]|uniref:Alpha/beta hydrolase n=1 Tax=Roseibium suaedae TaxID=735517 RepID=A0A1M7BCC8_9HYPH|nr:alpha/beta hydrolase-fold protein [Roseibium suaedae]SHL52571.1 hypothetical protein SAMN05444272_0787 [Roseibium suaedae]
MTGSAGAPCPIAHTTAHDLTCEQNGEVYRFLVHVPAGEAPEAGWPVLYMTDGNAVIATAVDCLRAQASYPGGTNVSHGVVVAIGYPTSEAYDPLRRSWDLCPQPGKSYPPFYPGTPEVRTGGGNEFLEFLENQVKPFVGRLAPVDISKQSLYGHSFGGLFALFTLFTRPKAFRNYIAVSPAISWDDGLLERYSKPFFADPPKDLEIFVHLSAGAYEGDGLAPFQTRAPDAETRLKKNREIRTAGLAEELARDLMALPGGKIRSHFESFPYETHMSVLPVSVGRAIQTAFALQPLGWLEAGEENEN